MTNSIEDREAWIADCRKRHADALRYYDAMKIRYEFADYKPQETLRYQGNPLIEALPLPWNKDKLIDRFGSYPEIESDIRNKPKMYRRREIKNIFLLVHPLDKHIEFGMALSDTIRDGYVVRNPFSHLRTETLTEEEEHKVYQKIRRLKELIRNLGLFGAPGMGKTTLARESFEMYRQLIFHGAYKGFDFPQTQVAWLFVECPHDASRSAFAKRLFRELDRLIYKGSYEKNYADTNNIDELIKNVVTVCRNLCVGFLGIDEIQRVSRAKAGGSPLFMEFLVQISNEVNLPLGFFGTSRAIPAVQPNVHFARRLSEDTNPEWRRMEFNDKDWKSLMTALGSYQYLHKPFKITKEINEALYDNSQGITALAVSLYAASQRFAIDFYQNPAREKLDSSLINSVAAVRFSFLNKAIKALRERDPKALELFEDIVELERSKYEKYVLDYGDDEEPIESNHQHSSGQETSLPNPPPADNATKEDTSQPVENDKPKISRKRKPKEPEMPNSHIIKSSNDLSSIAKKGTKQKIQPIDALTQAGFIAEASEFSPK